MVTPKFASVSQSFHTELKQRVNHYFTEAGKSFTAVSYTHLTLPTTPYV